MRDVPDWTREYFECGYGQRWGLLPPSDDVRREAGDLRNLLRLSPTCGVIDIGCGHGRHALALAERGINVIGLDSAVALLNRARQLGDARGVHVRWVRGDMRRLPFRDESAGGAIILDAFGFFDTEDEHEAALREAARVLRPDTRLALKVVNGGQVLDGFRSQQREERDGVVVSVVNTLTFDPPRMTQRIAIRGSRGDGEYERRQRLYRVDELRAVVEQAGLSVVGVFGDPAGAPFEPATSKTIWMVAQRGAVSHRLGIADA